MSLTDHSSERLDTASGGPADDPTAGSDPWRRVLAGAAATVIVVDAVFLALIRVVAHPLAVLAVLALVGLLLLRRRPRTGVAVVLLATVVALVDVPSTAVHLAYPTSGIDFLHAAVGIGGRLLVVVAAIAWWRRAGAPSARRVGVSAIGLLGATTVLALVASLVSGGEQLAPRDAVATIDQAVYSEAVVASGGSLFVDNLDLFRHTYTVVGTDIDVHLDARQGARIEVDVAPGTYDVICTIPHHDFMTGTLEVQA